ncbi:hypothetical protein FRC09_005872 [Ceratobasidium sp. 395]|nr:hypothetical protein FRC09_005872 [Ceratobasidium sp. 395]
MSNIYPSGNGRVRHGRRLHDTESNYGLPNDGEELVRLNKQHEAMKIILGSNYTAPLPELNSGAGPQSILDIASGSGQWVLEIAKEFPKAKVVGIDLSGPDLSQSEIPLNAQFITGDIRGLILLVEIGEDVSNTGLQPPAMIEKNEAISKIGHIKASRPSTTTASPKGSWSIATGIASDLRSSPSMWTNVHEKRLAVPIGVWTDDIAGQSAGKLLQYCVPELVKGFRPSLIDEGVLSGDQVDDLVTRLTNELKDGEKWKLETPYHFVWAEKT